MCVPAAERRRSRGKCLGREYIPSFRSIPLLKGSRGSFFIRASSPCRSYSHSLLLNAGVESKRILKKVLTELRIFCSHFLPLTFPLSSTFSLPQTAAWLGPLSCPRLVFFVQISPKGAFTTIFLLLDLLGKKKDLSPISAGTLTEDRCSKFLF